MQNSPLIRVVLVPAAAAATMALSGCGASAKVQETALIAEIPAVSVVRPSLHKMDRELTLTGEFRPWQQADLHAKIAGYLKTLTVDVGSRVAAGQLIGILEAPELEAEIQEARSAVLKAKSDEHRVAAGIRRAESLHDVKATGYRRLASVNQKEPGLIAAQELAESNAGVRAGEADVESAKANLEAARQST